MCGSFDRGCPAVSSCVRLELTTNVIENPQGLITRFTRRVKNWQTAEMVLRWQSAACLDVEQRMHRIAGHKHMELLKHALRPHTVRQRRSA
jgi:transposase-like protein